MNADGATPYDFAAQLAARQLELTPLRITTLQLNITRLCNQACRHCHVDASPARTEMMSGAVMAQCLAVLKAHPDIGCVDITGGAPELHPEFRTLVRAVRGLDRQVMVRHNLTVTFDAHPQTGASLADLPEFFAEQQVEVISSLPYYQAFFTDAQRGRGVFEKSVEGIRRLNRLGYGDEGGKLILNLVYNPAGPYLPAAQHVLEADYKRELRDRYGLRFNRLFTLTNMPIHRFRLHLEKTGQYADYMDKLMRAFNPQAAEGIMCRSLISVDWNGQLFDCDFHQQLALGLVPPAPATIFDFDRTQLEQRRIRWEPHCFGCTAGAGSSCSGATASRA